MIGRGLTAAPMRHPRNAPAGPDPAWALLLATTEGVNPTDPAGLVTGSVGFNSTTGIFDATTTAVATVTDGFAEAMPRWTRPFTDLFGADFDPDTDMAEIYVEILQWPSALCQSGPVAGVLDRVGAASSNGFVAGCLDTSGTGYRVVSMGAASFVATGNETGTLGAFRVQVQCLQGIFCTVWYDNTGVWTQPGSSNPADIPASFDPATWFLHVGLPHGSAAVVAGSQFRWKVYTRRVRLGSQEPA